MEGKDVVINAETGSGKTLCKYVYERMKMSTLRAEALRSSQISREEEGTYSTSIHSSQSIFHGFFKYILRKRKVRRGPARGGSHVAHLNFNTSRVSVYKCLSLIVSFAVTVAIWLREVVSCRNFILRAVATFWAMSLVRIYPGRTSQKRLPLF